MIPDLSRCSNKYPRYSDCYRFREDAEEYQKYPVNFKCICEEDGYRYYSPLEKPVEEVHP